MSRLIVSIIIWLKVAYKEREGGGKEEENSKIKKKVL